MECTFCHATISNTATVCPYCNTSVVEETIGGDDPPLTSPTQSEYVSFVTSLQNVVTSIKALISAEQTLLASNFTTLCSYEGPGFSDPTLRPSTGEGDPFGFLVPLDIVFNRPDLYQDMTKEERITIIMELKEALEDAIENCVPIARYIGFLFGKELPGTTGFNLIIPILPPIV